MSELHDQLARVKLHMGVGSCSSFVSRQQFTGVRPLFQTFPVSAVFRPKPAANQRRVLQEAPCDWLLAGWSISEASLRQSFAQRPLPPPAHAHHVTTFPLPDD